jgi:AcrR family transcriptional regulator
VGSTDRRERARAEIRARILDAARDLFATEGAASVTMRQIAERIEYTPPAIYTHFKDKNALLDALMHDDFQVFAQTFQATLRTEDPVERIAVMGRAYIDFAVSHPNHFRLLFMSPLRAVHHDMEVKGIPDRDAYAALKFVVAAALESGRLKPEHQDIRLISQSVWSCVHGVAALAVAMRPREDNWFDWQPLQQITDNCIDFAMRGLLPATDKYFTKKDAP